MKKILILVLAISLVATCAFAQEETTSTQSQSKSYIGARAGLSFSPDQFFIGAHMDLGKVIDPLRLVPNIEIGFGDNMTVLCFNGDLIYDFDGSPWSVGGELGIVHTSWDDNGISEVLGVDIDKSSTDIGLSALADYRLKLNNGKTLLLEGKLGLTDAPDFKLTVGYDLF